MNYKKDFPIFTKNNSLIYFDNAAGTQKPEVVIDAISDFYKNYSAPIYRSAYKLAEIATEKYEETRFLCAKFIGASAKEIAFTRGSTDGINIIANAWGLNNLRPGDEILISEAEHNSNIACWQRVCERTGAVLKWIPLNFDGTLNIDNLDELINHKTKLVSITGYSNVLGHIDNLTGHKNFLKYIAQKAHNIGAKILVDAAQLVPHFKIDVKDIGCDFLVYSGHKMLGPQGVGALFVDSKVHNNLGPSYVGGGAVIDIDNIYHVVREFPYLFEVGTSPGADIVGFGLALKYLEKIDFDWFCKHEEALCDQLIEGLKKFSKIEILGEPENFIKKGHLVCFNIDNINAHDVAAFLDDKNICVRAGTQCAHLIYKKMGFSSSVRVSFYLYNTHDEVDRFLRVLENIF